MDPLSISASITALLDFTSTVINYLNGVKGAAEDRRTILSEIASVNGILFILRDEADQAKQGDQWSSTLHSLNVQDGPLDQFRRALERLASQLASPATGLNKLGKAMKWPFKKEEIKEILGSIERQKGLLNLARQNDHVKLSRAIKDEMGLMRNEVEVIAKGVSKIEMSQITSEHLQIIDWLAAPDPSTNYNRARNDRNPKTGLWFIDGSAYTDWKTTPGSFIWLYGTPGCGKTILSSTILQNVLEECETTSAVLYFYFDFNDAEKERHEKMIRSLISQLSKCCESSVLQDLYSSCMKGGRQPAFEVLLETLHRMMESLGDIYVVIDALDECTEREQLLTDLEEMASWKDVSLHMLATSRRETDIEESLNLLSDERNRISIQSALVNADIRTYTHDRLQNDRKLRRWLKHPEVQLEIENTLVEKAAGMFRWAACQLDSLGNCFSLPNIRQALASLPRTLDETYARILCNIDRNYSDYNMQIMKALQWLTFSARPLRLGELAETFAIDTNVTPRFDPERRLPEPRDILTLCSSLIALSDSGDDDSKGQNDSELTAHSMYSQSDSAAGSSDTYVRLAHFSVKEYLVSDRIQRGAAPHYSIQETESHDVLAQDCIAYLLQLDEPGSLSSETIKTSPLLEYAAKFWAEHAKNAEKGPTQASTLLAMELFMTEREGFLNWIRIYNIDKYRKRDLSLRLDELASPLYYASRAGLAEPAKLLIEAGKGVNAHGGEYESAFQAAAIVGHIDIVQLLLDNGADINAHSGYYGSALQTASSLSNINIIQLLLDNGADINAQGGLYGSALQAASYWGQIDVVQLLLNNGAEINAQGGQYGNALLAALREGFNGLAYLLLENGAHVGDDGEALIAACRSRYQDGLEIVVKLLLEKGADVNLVVRNSYFGTALQAASCYDYEAIVRILLDNGADVNLVVKDSRFGTALQAASCNGHEAIVKILLENGADIDARGRYNQTAPIAACVSGHGRTVKLLLEKGANIDARGDGTQGSAVEVAAKEGHENIVKMLLDKGANVECIAVQAAAKKGHENIVKMLLDKGPDVEGMAVQVAPKEGREKIMEMLVAKGAVIQEYESSEDEYSGSESLESESESSEAKPDQSSESEHTHDSASEHN